MRTATSAPQQGDGAPDDKLVAGADDIAVQLIGIRQPPRRFRPSAVPDFYHDDGNIVQRSRIPAISAAS
jgi:hypothetical protein